MSCSYCFNLNCNGCLQNQQAYQAQAQFQNNGPFFGLNRTAPTWFGFPEDKSDIDIINQFMSEQEENQRAALDHFLRRCKECRPTITAAIVAKCKKLKAFL